MKDFGSIDILPIWNTIEKTLHIERYFMMQLSVACEDASFGLNTNVFETLNFFNAAFPVFN